MSTTFHDVLMLDAQLVQRRFPPRPLLVRYCSCGLLMKRDGKVMRCDHCKEVRFS